jgi:cell division protein FtsI/penicillin-binding protein 2
MNSIPVNLNNRSTVANRPADYRQSLQRRILLTCICLSLWGLIVVGRLGYYQFYRHNDLLNWAERQQQRTIKTNPKRGLILDSNGHELARSVEVESVYIAPQEIRDPESLVAPLAEILQLSPDVVRTRLTARKVLVSLKRKISDQEAEAIRQLQTQLQLKGIHFVPETKRFYPKDDLAAYVLGYVSANEEGFAGIERQYDRNIQGRPGYLLLETDAKGRPFESNERNAEPGQNLMLTIDEQIQYRTEQALREAVSSVGAKGGTAIVMRPKTGEVLAMTSLPGFNPNEPILSSAELREKRRNRAVEDAYEPGSVFKVVTYSAALENGILQATSQIDCQGGAITIAGHTIRDGGRYGLLTIAEAVEVSSNVAAIKTGKQLGREQLLAAIEKFGFGRPIGVGLPGESPGFVGGKRNWSDASYGALPIGYQVGATPLQVLAAVSAIANGGVWVQPHVLKQIVSVTGDVVHRPTVKTRSVVSKATAETMKEILAGVVLRGTAKLARLDGYSAGGKTGTAHKYDPATRRYSPTRYFATFCGFAPVQNPEIAVIVVIDEPRLGVHHGGQAAAPAFKRIAESALRYLTVPPDDLDEYFNDKKPMVVENEIPEEYTVRLDIESGENSDRANNSVKIDDEAPSTSKMLNDAQKIAASSGHRDTIAVLSFSQGEGSLIMPDLRGQGLRTALNRCKEMGLKLSFAGSGEINEQFPAPGTAVFPGMECQVKLKKSN